MEPCRLVFFSRRCLHRTKRFVSVFKSKERQVKHSYQGQLHGITSSRALSSETFLDISDTYTLCTTHLLSVRASVSYNFKL